MSCHVICHVISCYVMSCHVYRVMSCRNTIQYNAMQCNAMQRNAAQCSAAQRSTTQHNTTQHNTTWYNIYPFSVYSSNWNKLPLSELHIKEITTQSHQMLMLFRHKIHSLDIAQTWNKIVSIKYIPRRGDALYTSHVMLTYPSTKMRRWIEVSRKPFTWK